MYLITPRTATFILGQEVAEVEEWATGIWCRFLKGRPRLVKRDRFTLENMIRQEENHCFQTIQYSPRVLVIWDDQERNGWKFLTYLGFPSREAAENTALALCKKDPAIECTLRPAKRLKNSCGWEIKVKGLAWSGVEFFIKKDLNIAEEIEINMPAEMALQGG